MEITLGKSYEDGIVERKIGKPHPHYEENIIRLRNYLLTLPKSDQWRCLPEKDAEAFGGPRFIDVVFQHNDDWRGLRINMHNDTSLILEDIGALKKMKLAPEKYENQSPW